MAMIKCKECRKKISSEAKTCPNCGIGDPYEPESVASSILNTLVGIGVVVGLIMWCAHVVDNEDDIQATRTKSKSSKTSPWKIVALTDKFGDTTNKKLLLAEATGTFSNSATSNSRLSVDVRIESDGTAGIVLYEYGSSRMTACCSQVNPYWITIKRTNGHTKKFTAKAYVHGWLVRLNSPKTFVKFLKKSVGNVRIHIQDDRSSSYLFTLSTTGMTKAYNRFKRRQR